LGKSFLPLELIDYNKKVLASKTIDAIKKITFEKQ
jgi:hypothetical protein